MPSELAGKNAVVLANNFNPSIVTERWLVRTGIVTNDEFESPGLYTPPLVQVRTSVFEMLVMDERIQVTPKPNHDAEAFDRLILFIRTLPETPYTAVGLNFHWKIQPEQGTAAEMTRALFVRPGGAFEQVTAGAETVYGGIAYLPSNAGKLKLELIPAQATNTQLQQDSVLAVFNYHFQVEEGCEQPHQAAIQSLEQWAALEQRSREIIEGLTG